MNLHHIWDGGVGAFDNSSTPEEVEMMARDIEKRYPANYFGNRVTDLNPKDWAKEGMEVAKKYVYSTPKEQDVSSNYVENGRQIAEQEVALAGYRLAGVLNKLLA